MRGTSGFALAYVLIMSVVLSVIAAGMISLMTHQYQIANRQENSAKTKKNAEGLLSQALTAWQITGNCPIAGYSCVPATGGVPPAACGCVCTLGSEVVLALAGTASNCAMTINYPFP